MSSAFADLIALSQTQTKESQADVEARLRSRKQREQKERKAREQREEKERNEEKRRLTKVFEQEKRKQEQALQELERQKALEATRLRREEDQRDALRYGPKKAKADPKWPSSASSSSTSSHPRRRDDNGNDSDHSQLTRLEIRERKQRLEQQRAARAGQRAAPRRNRPHGRLPGGALDSTTAPMMQPAKGPQTTRERLSAMTPILIPLNQVKRDVRTIDEIHTEIKGRLAKPTLEGDAAKGFDDWFGGDNKKKEKEKRTQSSTPPPAPAPPPKKSSTPKPVHNVPVAKSSRASSYDDRSVSSKSNSVKTIPASRSSASSHKRRRTDSLSASPPPAKRRHRLDDDDESKVPRDLIWSLLRPNRNNDFQDVLSDDDEDMEVDATVLEREEKRSARVAKQEDIEALAAEKRHEEEKRRRKLGRY
ncbi:hypothetical protein C8J56DRAFT_1004061 [Mycena floridula]|nr:hypothetical protein C8J56DRAFT_1004061 [Mycena floridula]